MADVSRTGIIAVLEQIVRDKESETLIQEHIELLISHAEITLDIKEGKEARRQGKTLKNAKKYVAAAEEFIHLSKLNKPVSARRLYDSLIIKYPDSTGGWKYNTIRDWHKLMKEAVLQTPIGSGVDVFVDI